jgi:uncharacterized protein YcaQ
MARASRAQTVRMTKREACRFLLAHQGLWPPRRLEGKAGVLGFFRRVGCIQFDPLNIVGHNPELVLQSRVADLTPAMLQELLYADRKLLDGLDKVMSIYSVEDRPYFERFRAWGRRRLADRKHEAVAAIVPRVREAIRERGPLSSKDLDHNETVDWSWARARVATAALESMHLCGDLVIHHKVHTRKVYDLAERHIAPEILAAPDPNPTDEAFHDWRVLRRIGGIGLIWNRDGDTWCGMDSIRGPQRAAALQRLQDQGKVVRVRVDGIDMPLYARREDLATAKATRAGTPQAAILAPLDNLLWCRQLVRELFGFDYTWEVYKPVAQRQYGYYVLPVLYGDRFVARFEPVRHKADGALVIKNWWWEPGVKPSKAMQAAFCRCLRRFLAYLGAQGVKLDGRTRKARGLTWLAGVAR